ncbi:MAG: phosphoribosylamine--glycine ligase [Treponema sp.]|jgi:phosphoribosylamine--glycine ligase|nr:phosphoribosylamine--glycine ligase [Treponema sp.]
MNILVIGAGAREHAIAWKLALSPRVERVFVAPGNAGTAMEEKCVNIAPNVDLLKFAKEKECLTVVGPEAPLVEGVVDQFREQGLPIAGPDKNAAHLEASKAFSKRFMEKYGVRCAKSRTFSVFDEATRYVQRCFASKNVPLAIKADGLAAGKGVVVAGTLAEAEGAVSSFMKDEVLGNAGKTLVVEDFLDGREASILAAVGVNNGKGCILPFTPARDHKRRFDGDKGPNTGGMGAIAPVPDFSSAAQADFQTSILEPTLKGLRQEGFDYRGFLFFGLMVKDDRCFLLEYNVRLGDPETQAVLPLMESDFAELCLAVLDGALDKFPLIWKKGAVCAPVAVSDGYPGQYRKGVPVTISAKLAQTGAKLFVAGADLRDGGLFTTGGRVLTVSAYGADLAAALQNAADALSAVAFDGMGFRKDIGEI